MGGNWIACSERKERTCYALQPNWLLWVCGVKSYFQALNAKGLLSHSCRVHFSQPFPSTPAPVSPGPADGCWKGSGGGAQGPLYLWGNDQSLLCVETLRAFAEEERIRWMWNLELTVALQLSLKNALGQPWDVHVIHYLHVQIEWGEDSSSDSDTFVFPPLMWQSHTGIPPKSYLFYWHFDSSYFLLQQLIFCCLFACLAPLCLILPLWSFVFSYWCHGLVPQEATYEKHIITLFFKRKKERKTANWVTKKWLTSSCRAGGSVHLGPILHSSAHLQPNYNHQLHQQFLPPLMWQLLCRTYKQSNECISNLIIDFSWPVHFPNNTIKQILIKEDLLFYGSWSHEVLLSEY